MSKNFQNIIYLVKFFINTNIKTGVAGLIVSSGFFSLIISISVFVHYKLLGFNVAPMITDPENSIQLFVGFLSNSLAYFLSVCFVAIIAHQSEKTLKKIRQNPIPQKEAHNSNPVILLIRTIRRLSTWTITKILEALSKGSDDTDLIRIGKLARANTTPSEDANENGETSWHKKISLFGQKVDKTTSPSPHKKPSNPGKSRIEIVHGRAKLAFLLLIFFVFSTFTLLRSFPNYIFETTPEISYCESHWNEFPRNLLFPKCEYITLGLTSPEKTDLYTFEADKLIDVGRLHKYSFFISTPPRLNAAAEYRKNILVVETRKIAWRSDSKSIVTPTPLSPSKIEEKPQKNVPLHEEEQELSNIDSKLANISRALGVEPLSPSCLNQNDFDMDVSAPAPMQILFKEDSSKLCLKAGENTGKCVSENGVIDFGKINGKRISDFTSELYEYTTQLSEPTKVEIRVLGFSSQNAESRKNFDLSKKRAAITSKKISAIISGMKIQDMTSLDVTNYGKGEPWQYGDYFDPYLGDIDTSVLVLVCTPASNG